MSTAVYMCRPPCTLPCTGRVHGPYTAVYSAVFMAHTRPCNVYTACTQLCSQAVSTCTLPCTRTRPCIRPVHAVYTVVYIGIRPVHRHGYGLSRWPCDDRENGRVRGPYMAVNTAYTWRVYAYTARIRNLQYLQLSYKLL